MMMRNEKERGSLTLGGLAFGILLFVAACIAFMGMYTVDEGHVGIVKKWGEAVREDQPGLHFKLPIRDSVEEIDIRPRKSEEQLSASTSEQMPAQAVVSFNWAVSADQAMNTYKRYGGLPQFEDRILDPMMRSTAKAAISTFTAEEIIQNRVGVIAAIEEGMTDRIGRYPGISVDSVQLENIDFPPAYLESIQDKQRAKNEADKAEQELRKQETESRQQVNTANAERDSQKARADGNAYAIEVEAKANAESIRLRGEAEADAIEAQAKALSESPIMVDYIKAKNWNGQMPSTVMGGNQSVLWQMGE